MADVLPGLGRGVPSQPAKVNEPLRTQTSTPIQPTIQSPIQSPTPIQPIQPTVNRDSPVDSIESAWTSYTAHLNKWFFKPDIEAVRIVLSVAAAQFHKSCDPVWLMVLGPSSGDKTSICINSLLDIPNVHMKGDLTPKTFLSGYTGTANASLLHQISNGILAFKDFTTMGSKRAEDQAEIAAQLREIYDGSFVKDTGKGNPISWKGKLTVIAAATVQFESKWAARRDLGERFIQVRIARKDGVEQGERAQRQRGFEEHITKTTRNLAREFFQATPPIINPPPKLSTHQMRRVAAMSEIVSHCRGVVSRNQYSGAIDEIPSVENSGRMSKELGSLIANHAALFRKETIDESDMGIGRRVALDCIPHKRAGVLEHIPLNGTIGTDQLRLLVGLPESTMGYIIGDLEALGALRVVHNSVIANEVSLTPLIQQLWAQAFDPLSQIPEGQVAPPVI
jgi:hypothetical protein